MAFTPDSDGRTALHRAATAGDASLVANLLQLPGAASASSKSDDGGYTPLHCASAAGAVSVIPLLLAAGADANVPTLMGALPLHLHKGRADVVAALAPATRTVNAVDGCGGTALHRAAARGEVDAARALLAAGADLEARDGEGKTALFLAIEEGREAAVMALLREGARVSHALAGAPKWAALERAGPALQKKMAAVAREMGEGGGGGGGGGGEDGP